MKTIKAWFLLHVKQLAVLGLWLVGLYLAHKYPSLREDIAIASPFCLALGIQLPPMVFSRATLAKLLAGLASVLAAGLFVIACAARTVAKDAYYAQQEACLQAYSTPAEQKACVAGVRSAWSDAGAPPAATAPVDAGVDGKDGSQ